jgi:hypothetical protein
MLYHCSYRAFLWLQVTPAKCSMTSGAYLLLFFELSFKLVLCLYLQDVSNEILSVKLPLNVNTFIHECCLYIFFSSVSDHDIELTELWQNFSIWQKLLFKAVALLALGYRFRIVRWTINSLFKIAVKMILFRGRKMKV